MFPPKITMRAHTHKNCVHAEMHEHIESSHNRSSGTVKNSLIDQKHRSMMTFLSELIMRCNVFFWRLVNQVEELSLKVFYNKKNHVKQSHIMDTDLVPY